MMMEIHVEAATAINHLAVFAHFLAIVAQYFIGRGMRFILQGDYRQAEQVAGKVHVGAMVLIIRVLLHAGARIKGQAGVSNIGASFLDAERAKRRANINVILLPITLIMRADGAPSERDKTNETQQSCLEWRSVHIDPPYDLWSLYDSLLAARLLIRHKEMKSSHILPKR